MNEQAVDVDRLQHMCTIARMLEHPPREPPDLGEFAARIRQADMTLGDH